MLKLGRKNGGGFRKKQGAKHKKEGRATPKRNKVTGDLVLKNAEAEDEMMKRRGTYWGTASLRHEGGLTGRKVGEEVGENKKKSSGGSIGKKNNEEAQKEKEKESPDEKSNPPNFVGESFQVSEESGKGSWGGRKLERTKRRGRGGGT